MQGASSWDILMKRYRTSGVIVNCSRGSRRLDLSSPCSGRQEHDAGRVAKNMTCNIKQQTFEAYFNYQTSTNNDRQQTNQGEIDVKLLCFYLFVPSTRYANRWQCSWRLRGHVRTLPDLLSTVIEWLLPFDWKQISQCLPHGGVEGASALINRCFTCFHLFLSRLQKMLLAFPGNSCYWTLLDSSMLKVLNLLFSGPEGPLNWKPAWIRLDVPPVGRVFRSSACPEKRTSRRVIDCFEKSNMQVGIAHTGRIWCNFLDLPLFRLKKDSTWQTWPFLQGFSLQSFEDLEWTALCTLHFEALGRAPKRPFFFDVVKLSELLSCFSKGLVWIQSAERFRHAALVAKQLGLLLPNRRYRFGWWKPS